MFNTDEIDEGMKNYFKSLKHFKTLKKEEEHKLLEAYKNHKDLDARNKLIEANLKYACKLANSYRGRGLSFSELVTEANDGLIEAIDQFDLNKDVKVITYSKWYIIQKINNAIKERNMLDGRDISEYNDFGENQADDDTDYQVSDRFIEDDYDETYNEDIEELLNTLMSKLSNRERDMISSYYGVNSKQKKTLDEIGNDYGLTKERVRQIIEKALLKARSEALLVDSVYLNQ